MNDVKKLSTYFTGYPVSLLKSCIEYLNKNGYMTLKEKMVNYADPDRVYGPYDLDVLVDREMYICIEFETPIGCDKERIRKRCKTDLLKPINDICKKVWDEIRQIVEQERKGLQKE
jgi:hypothetical protein